MYTLLQLPFIFPRDHSTLVKSRTSYESKVEIAVSRIARGAEPVTQLEGPALEQGGDEEEHPRPGQVFPDTLPPSDPEWHPTILFS